LPGSRGFSWRLTGRQNLVFYALLYGLQEEEANKRIEYLLKFTGLEERADDGYQRYSTGMQRKLLLCRALLRDTSILLFDEPTVGLDPASASEFRRLLHDKLAKEEKKTILVSTHNLFEAQEMCDRIAILDHGRITACDTPDNVRYKMFDENLLQIIFYEEHFNNKQKRMLDELKNLSGIYGITPQIQSDLNIESVSIRIDKNLDLSKILDIIIKSGIKIRKISTLEPTLEDAFIAITRKNSLGNSRQGGFRRP
jgi:ABC-2 type transport system ATP-binding protein